jgi:hypothetical protein
VARALPERRGLLQAVLLQVARRLRRAARVRRVAPEQEVLLRHKVLALLAGRVRLLVAPAARLVARVQQAVALIFSESLTTFLPPLWRN